MTYRPDLYAGRRVVVIGGTSGIGAAIADAFEAHGASITLTGANDGEVETCRAALPYRDCHRLDVRDGTEVRSWFDGRVLDVLVNCAGVTRRDLAEHEPEVFTEVIDVNLNGMMRTSHAARKALGIGQGCIVNIASMLSFFGSGGVPAYAASKGGVAQLTKSLAIAYAVDGIRVNAIAPGYIATRLTGALQEDTARSEAIVARTPMKRWGRPEDVAQAALFMASPAASFMTGAIVPVDGGYLIA